MYGDIENLEDDKKVLYEILKRQGSKLFLHVISEYTGLTAIKFKLKDTDKDNIIKGLISEFKESLLERL